MTGLSTEEVCLRFKGKQSVDMKDELAEIVIEKLGPIREKMEQLEDDQSYVDEVLRKSAEKARSIAEENMTSIGELMGIQ